MKKPGLITPTLEDCSPWESPRIARENYLTMQAYAEHLEQQLAAEREAHDNCNQKLTKEITALQDELAETKKWLKAADEQVVERQKLLAKAEKELLFAHGVNETLHRKLAAAERARDAETRLERERVVAWLRAEGAEPLRGGMSVTEKMTPSTRRELRDQASFIEAGAHEGVKK